MERDDGGERQVTDWIARARTALAWHEGEAIAPVLEALALSGALEATGALAEVPPALRDDLRRIGQRALLHVSAELGREDDEDALRTAAALARDGLRALAGRPIEQGDRGEAPSARELARLLAGTAEPLEAAAIAIRARGSEQARKELAWALRMRREEPARVRLAAADGEPMHDPARGRLLARVGEGEDGAPAAEIYGFAEGRIAIYAASGEPVRLEAPGARTEAMQAGYWAGSCATEAGTLAGTLHVGDRAIAIRVAIEA